MAHLDLSVTLGPCAFVQLKSRQICGQEKVQTGFEGGKGSSRTGKLVRLVLLLFLCLVREREDGLQRVQKVNSRCIGLRDEKEGRTRLVEATGSLNGRESSIVTDELPVCSSEASSEKQ
jgi:hypothetical protein